MLGTHSDDCLRGTEAKHPLHLKLIRIRMMMMMMVMMMMDVAEEDEEDHHYPISKR